MGSTGALLTGSKTGAWEILSLLQALKHHRDHDCSLLNGKNHPFLACFTEALALRYKLGLPPNWSGRHNASTGSIKQEILVKRYQQRGVREGNWVSPHCSLSHPDAGGTM